MLRKEEICTVQRDNSLLGAVAGCLLRPIEFAPKERLCKEKESPEPSESRFIKSYYAMLWHACTLNKIWCALQQEQKAYWIELY